MIRSLFGGAELKTKYIEIYERSRWFRASDQERYALKIHLLGSQQEIEKMRKAIIKLIEEGS